MALVRVLSVVGYFALPPAFFIGFALLSGGLEGYGPLHAASFACGITSYLMFCLQFVLAARPRLLERAFGLDALFRFHAGAAPAAILLAVAHGQFLVLAQGKAPGYLPYTLGGIALTAYAVLGIAAVLLLGGARVGGIHAVARMRSIAQRAGLDYGRSKVFHNASLIVSAVACVHALAVPVVAYSSPLRLLFALPFAAAFCFWLRHKAFRSGRSFGIVAMEREAPRVTMLRVRALDEYSWKPFRGLRAGQFAFIRPRIPGLGREFHPFTIAGWDAGSHELVFRIKAVGDWTMRLLDSIPSFPGERGDHPWTVALDGPCGRFCLGDRMPKGCEQGPVVCIAGGIGVTPFLAMAAEELRRESQRPFLLLWGARTREDLVGLDELADMTRRRPMIRTVPVLSADPLWQGQRGKIDAKAIETLASTELRDPSSSYWLCGPLAMRQGVAKALDTLGVPRSRIRYEDFSL